MKQGLSERVRPFGLLPKIPQMRGWKQQNLCLTVPEAGHPGGRCRPIGCLGISPWLDHGPVALSLRGRERKNSGLPLSLPGCPPWGPTHWALSHPKRLPRAPQPMLPTGGGGFAIWIGGEGVQSTAVSGFVATEAPEEATRV